MKQKIYTGCILFITCLQTAIIYNLTKDTAGTGTNAETSEITATLVKKQHQIDSCYLLAIATAMVESSLDSNKVVKKTDAVGFLQIRPIKVAEINRLLNLKNKTKNVVYYTLADRYSVVKSIEMFRIEMEHKNPKLNIGKCVKLWYGSYDQKYYAKLLNNYKLLLYIANYSFE